ncbi:MAG: hypothetical protein QMD53_02930 [Actinomycetota bacterium]|nr:hypothetical protein [Actinomycetota bacterium]
MNLYYIFADKGWRTALADNPHLRAGLNIALGKVAHQEVAHDLKLPFTQAETILA